MGSAAEPILASSIWASHQLKHHLSENETQARPARQRRLLTGCRNVDQGLPEIFSYGNGGLICISFEHGAGGQEVGDVSFSLHDIASS